MIIIRIDIRKEKYNFLILLPLFYVYFLEKFKQFLSI